MKLSRRTFHRLMALGSGRLAFSSSLTSLFGEPSSAALQPFAAQAGRLVVALQTVGSPLSSSEVSALLNASSQPNEQGIAEIQRILDPHVLLEARINPEGRVSVNRGKAKAELVENGWRAFLVKVDNDAGTTSSFNVRSEQAEPMGRPSGEAIVGVHDSTNGAVDTVLAESRWIAIDNWANPPLTVPLSGLDVEYRILLLYSREHGQREASLEAMLGDEEQDLGFRSTLAILFDCLPSEKISFQIKDADGTPTTASLLITDGLNRIYPAQNKRLAPDLWFEKHIYRSDGEGISLPAGEYFIDYTRGPEYLPKRMSLAVHAGDAQAVALQLERWITPRQFGYYSGDTHIHAAGCSHYESPSEGVTPEVMYRQVRGEALDVGDVLTWGPGYYYQKKFFTGHVEKPPTEAGAATLRYDLEVSGFPSSHCGHLVLLSLKEQDYPGTASLDQWPSWNVPILKWARSQGALVGYAHSGHGLNVASTEIPNYLIPPFDSMGANEYIADVTHEGLVDFISGCDTRPFAELNIWYHTLNCGFRTAFVGETDFPCLSDERVGGGRTYVQMSATPAGDDGYEQWISGIVSASSYFGDGRSHWFHFAINAGALRAEEPRRESQLEKPGKIHVTATICALLSAKIDAAADRIRKTSPYDKPYWHLERARIGDSRRVPVELIVNGLPVQRVEIEADGSPHDVHFDVEIERSSWIALRILPSSHTNPLFVVVNGMPIRASKQSAQWCRAGVDVCWTQKSKRIRPSEMEEAAAAFNHARQAYDRILVESYDDLS